MKVQNSIKSRIAIIQKRDKRFQFHPRFPKPLSPDNGKRLLDHLEQLPSAIARVEKRFRQGYGIRKRFKHVFIGIPPSSFNTVLCALHPPAVTYVLGNPFFYEKLFENAEAIFAHEMGHLVSSFLPNGKLRYTFDSISEMNQIDIGYLKNEGSISFKYLTGVNYGLLPRALLFKDQRLGLHYYLRELIANRVAELIVGTEKEAQRIASQNLTSLKKSNPWAKMFDLVTADVFSLHAQAQASAEMLSRIEVPWERVISTQKLKRKMAAFYQKINLIGA